MIHLSGNDRCILYEGTKNAAGYGVLPWAVHGSRLAHRAALATKLGRKLVGSVLHSCDNPPCINPDHLREGTQAENMADAKCRGRARGGRFDQAACSKGHPMTEENTRLKPNKKCRNGVERVCRTCQRAQSTRNNDARRGIAKKREEA